MSTSVSVLATPCGVCYHAQDQQGPATLLDDGAAVLATSRMAIAVSRALMTRTRDLIVTYRGHRFRVLRGGSDGHDGNTNDISRRGTAGGYARAARLTPEQRQKIARIAAQARWERFRNGVGTGPPDARLGGLARAQRLTSEQRREIARKASEARLSRAVDSSAVRLNGDEADGAPEIAPRQ